MVLASGVNFGVRRSIPHMLGVGIGFALMLAIIGLGLGNVFVAYPLIYTIMKYVGAAYMLVLAWKIATAGPMGDTVQTGKPLSFIQAALFQWVNPKAWVIAVTANATYNVGNELGSSMGGADKPLLARVGDVPDLQRVSDGTLKLSMDRVALDDVLPSVSGLLTPMAQARDVRLSCRVPSGLCIHADATRTRRILLNLRSDAIKYNVNRGSAVCAALLNPDGGIGMSLEQLTPLYEPFNRLGRESLKVGFSGLAWPGLAWPGPERPPIPA